MIHSTKNLLITFQETGFPGQYRRNANSHRAKMGIVIQVIGSHYTNPEIQYT